MLGGFLVGIYWFEQFHVEEAIQSALNEVQKEFQRELKGDARRLGVVIDFMILDAGMVRTGIFNFADMAILAGVALILFGGRKSRDDEGGADDETAAETGAGTPTGI